MGSVSIESSVEQENFDVIIVGAGLSGLLAAKTFLDIQPTINLLIVERETSIGGVWSKDRIYPGLNVQTAPEYFELPYLSLKEVEPPVEYNGAGFLTGPSMCRYLELWTEKMGLMKYIRLSTSVRQITRDPDGKRWQCHIVDSGKVLVTGKLVVANGITSVPKYPNIDYSKFTPPVMHYRYFGERRAEWDREEVKEAVVYGAGKGSWDNLVQLVKAGKKVKWVIRNEGRGPTWMMLPKLPGGKHSEVLGFSRVLCLILPALYQDDGFAGLHYFFKRNFIGKAIMKFFMNSSRAIAISTMAKPITENVKKAIPDLAPFWMYHPIAVNNYDVNIYDYLRNGAIEVVRDTIVGMEGNTITLSSGETFTTDCVVFGTGWKADVSMFHEDPELEMELGIPTTKYTDEYLQKWEALDKEADKKVYAANPILKDAPAPPKLPPQDSGPFRLYHYMVPTNFADRSIAFLGVTPSTGTIPQGMIQGLWVAAYMMGKLDLPSKEEMEKATAYELRFCQIRHIGIGNDFPLISFDFMGIVTMFLKELGLNPWMKKGYFSEIFDTYTCNDYEDIAQKWMTKHGIVLEKPTEVQS
ncbi:hypothetical protein ABW19_dt0201144 [Dactylella cylindrospora]|nr:hypothetical protein ABW19_dt0201144 [Dactylella cylindrospora]